MDVNRRVKVLFVCMGNICRSPTAHGVFAQKIHAAGLAEVIEVDSAGTHTYHIGNAPDVRSQQAAVSRGYDLSEQRARKIVVEDFTQFDYILAMDDENLHDLLHIMPQKFHSKLSTLLDFSTASVEREVPDPYYGGARGFEKVLDLVEAATTDLLQYIRDKHQL